MKTEGLGAPAYYIVWHGEAGRNSAGGCAG